MNTDKYLERIGLSRPLRPNAETLKLLQHRHLLSIPFENLDIHWKRPITLDTARFYEKIVENGRGGFCYELNGLFNELLKSLGYETRLISARVFNGTNHGPEYDHAAMILTIDGQEYLVDVGFGDFAAEPLRFVLDEEQQDPTGKYVIRKFDDDYFEVAKLKDDAWVSSYIFQNAERDLAEFAEMCDFQQYSPDSHFTKGKLCSILTLNGRKTLTDKSLLSTVGAIKDASDINSDEEFSEVLMREFGIAAV